MNERPCFRCLASPLFQPPAAANHRNLVAPVTMSRTIKALVAKLKDRRKSRLWRHRKAGQVRDELVGEEGEGLTKQIADLSLNPSEAGSTVVDNDLQTPQIFGNPDFKYEFGFSSVCISWPGPSYDESSQFAPGIFDKPRHPRRRPKQKSSKRRLSQEERPVMHRRSEQPAPPPPKAVIRPTKTLRWPQYHGVPPPRDPPNHLLNLPGEIRNEIYRILCLSEDIIPAQFRLIIKPRHGRTKKAEIMRRFPQEPLLALCCKQLRQEMLSLFYSENKFVFHRSEHAKLNGLQSSLSMTREENIEKWAPSSGLADSLRHVELHFKARAPTFKAFCITYIFSKSAAGTIRISNNAESIDYCTCFEDQVLKFVNSLKCAWDGEDLATVAACFSHRRREQLQEDASISTEYPYSIYRPNKAICDDCELETLKELGSGF